MEVYVDTLFVDISMFFKRMGKETLLAMFEEDRKIEFEILGCKENQHAVVKKDQTQQNKGTLILNKPQQRTDMDDKDKEDSKLEK